MTKAIDPSRTDEVVSDVANVSRDTIRKIEQIENTGKFGAGGQGWILAEYSMSDTKIAT